MGNNLVSASEEPIVAMQFSRDEMAHGINNEHRQNGNDMMPSSQEDQNESISESGGSDMDSRYFSATIGNTVGEDETTNNDKTGSGQGNESEFSNLDTYTDLKSFSSDHRERQQQIRHNLFHKYQPQQQIHQRTSQQHLQKDARSYDSMTHQAIGKGKRQRGTKHEAEYKAKPKTQPAKQNERNKLLEELQEQKCNTDPLPLTRQPLAPNTHGSRHVKKGKHFQHRDIKTKRETNKKRHVEGSSPSQAHERLVGFEDEIAKTHVGHGMKQNSAEVPFSSARILRDSSAVIKESTHRRAKSLNTVLRNRKKQRNKSEYDKSPQSGYDQNSIQKKFKTKKNHILSDKLDNKKNCTLIEPKSQTKPYMNSEQGHNQFHQHCCNKDEEPPSISVDQSTSKDVDVMELNQEAVELQSDLPCPQEGEIVQAESSIKPEAVEEGLNQLQYESEQVIIDHITGPCLDKPDEHLTQEQDNVTTQNEDNLQISENESDFRKPHATYPSHAEILKIQKVHKILRKWDYSRSRKDKHTTTETDRLVSSKEYNCHEALNNRYRHRSLEPTHNDTFKQKPIKPRRISSDERGSNMRSRLRRSNPPLFPLSFRQRDDIANEMQQCYEKHKNTLKDLYLKKLGHTHCDLEQRSTNELDHSQEVTDMPLTTSVECRLSPASTFLSSAKETCSDGTCRKNRASSRKRKLLSASCKPSKKSNNIFEREKSLGDSTSTITYAQTGLTKQGKLPKTKPKSSNKHRSESVSPQQTPTKKVTKIVRSQSHSSKGGKFSSASNKHKLSKFTGMTCVDHEDFVSSVACTLSEAPNCYTKKCPNCVRNTKSTQKRNPTKPKNIKRDQSQSPSLVNPISKRQRRSRAKSQGEINPKNTTTYSGKRHATVTSTQRDRLDQDSCSVNKDKIKTLDIDTPSNKRSRWKQTQMPKTRPSKSSFQTHTEERPDKHKTTKRRHKTVPSRKVDLRNSTVPPPDEFGRWIASGSTTPLAHLDAEPHNRSRLHTLCFLNSPQTTSQMMPNTVDMRNLKIALNSETNGPSYGPYVFSYASGRPQICNLPYSLQPKFWEGKHPQTMSPNVFQSSSLPNLGRVNPARFNDFNAQVDFFSFVPELPVCISKLTNNVHKSAATVSSEVTEEVDNGSMTQITPSPPAFKGLLSCLSGTSRDTVKQDPSGQCLSVTPTDANSLPSLELRAGMWILKDSSPWANPNSSTATASAESWIKRRNPSRSATPESFSSPATCVSEGKPPRSPPRAKRGEESPRTATKGSIDRRQEESVSHTVSERPRVARRYSIILNVTPTEQHVGIDQSSAPILQRRQYNPKHPQYQQLHHQIRREYNRRDKRRLSSSRSFERSQLPATPTSARSSCLCCCRTSNRGYLVIFCCLVLGASCLIYICRLSATTANNTANIK